MNQVITVLILITLMFAVAYDVKLGRIPNKLNGGFLVAGLVLCLIHGGIKGLAIGALGALIPIICLMPLFAYKVLGAGDIKLLAAIGTYVGLNICWVGIYSFLTCGLYGMVLLVKKLITKVRMDRTWTEAISFSRQGDRYTKTAFSIFIALGFVWYLVKGGSIYGV